MIANIRRGGYDRLHALPRGEGGGHGVVGRGVGCAVFLGAGRRLKNGVLCGVQAEIDRVESGDEHPVENAGVVIRPFGDPLNAADERPVWHLQLVLAVFGDDDRAADAVFAGIDEQRLVLLVHPYLDQRGRTELLNNSVADEKRILLHAKRQDEGIVHTDTSSFAGASAPLSFHTGWAVSEASAGP